MPETNIRIFGGNIGIGTNNPGAYKFRVYTGNAKFENLKVEDITVNGTSSAFIPPLCIALWSKTIGEIPTGWYLCDGTNGTPDLRGRMVYGASNTANYQKGQSGGAADYVVPTAALAAHDHPTSNPTGSSGGHSHNVTVRRTNNCQNREGIQGANFADGDFNSTYGHSSNEDGDHNHAIPDTENTGQASNNNKISTLPRVRGLYWIMKA